MKINILLPILFIAYFNNTFAKDVAENKEKISYYKNGVIKSRVTIVNNKPTGKGFKYYNTGTVKTTVEFDNDSCSFTTYFNQKGFVFSQGEYINKRKNGQWKFYSYNKLWLIKTYSKDSLNGKTTELFPNGTPRIIDLYVDGKKNGRSVEYNNRHQIVQEKKYLNGVLDGHFKEFSIENGIPIVKGFYNNGKKDGFWAYYSKEGVNKVTIEYKDGTCLEPEKLKKLKVESLKAEEKQKEKYVEMNDEKKYADKMFFSY